MHHQWPTETTYLECKAYLRGSGRLLRARTPELARQEAWALLAVYQAIRTIIARAAARDGIDPDQISFTTTLNAIRRTTSTPRHQLRATLDTTEAEILSRLTPQRAGRIYPRAVRKPIASYPSRRNAKTPISQHATCTLTITPTRTTTPAPPDQARHPQTTTTRPP